MNVVFFVLAILLVVGTIKAQDCFSSNAELKQAVDDYVLDPANSNSEVALRYGWPMNEWCVENIEDFSYVFSGDRNTNLRTFNENISGWKTTSARNMEFMFYFAESFNQPLESWNTSSVTTMEGMFYSARSFDQPLEGWDTSRVTTMKWMFNNAESFNKPLEGWNTSRVTTMALMFAYSAESFNQPLEGWDTSSVTTMQDMFAGARLFNQPLEGWNVSLVTRMDYMFYQASLFNQDLCPWGPQLQGRSVDTNSMFVGTDCPITSTPDSDASQPGPFCVECQSTDEQCPCGRFRLLCRLIRFRLCVPYN